MLIQTVSQLRCPKKKKGSPGHVPSHGLCHGKLSVSSRQSGRKDPVPGKSDFNRDLLKGELTCLICGARYPILQGVAILVPNVREYLISHVKGISAVVPDSEIPKEFYKDYLRAKADLDEYDSEEDLEDERVNALYVMTHYLQARDLSPTAGQPWWKPQQPTSSRGATPGSSSNPSPSSSSNPSNEWMDRLIRECWDRGPFDQIEKWLSELQGSQKSSPELRKSVELGCGVGGLSLRLQRTVESYLGVDSSFASIALARHLVLGAPGPRAGLRIPEDVLMGSVSRPIRFSSSAAKPSMAARASSAARASQAQPVRANQERGNTIDFIVGDLTHLPLEPGQYDLSLALNAIDMLEDPAVLPEIQKRLLKKNGMAIQSSPYIWHPSVSKKLRKKLPQGMTSSSAAVEWLYQKAGFKITQKREYLPWLFFKNIRQLEIYFVEIFLAKRLEKNE